MRGAPQVGFSATIWKINWRSSLEILFALPTSFRLLPRRVQYRRNPARCQPATVSGATRRSHLFQSDQSRRVATQKACRINQVWVWDAGV